MKTILITLLVLFTFGIGLVIVVHNQNKKFKRLNPKKKEEYLEYLNHQFI